MPVKLNSSGGGSVTLDVPSTASTFNTIVPANSGTLVTTGSAAVVTPAMLTQPLTRATSQSATGTNIDFTSIPSWVRRITVMFNGISSTGSSNILVQLGAGSVTTSGYVSQGVQTASASTSPVTSTAGFILTGAKNSSATYAGICTITNISGNNWVTSGTLVSSIAGNINYFGGSSALSGTLDRVRITTVNGTDTFDAGTINIMYEG